MTEGFRDAPPQVDVVIVLAIERHITIGDGKWM